MVCSADPSQRSPIPIPLNGAPVPEAQHESHTTLYIAVGLAALSGVLAIGSFAMIYAWNQRRRNRAYVESSAASNASEKGPESFSSQTRYGGGKKFVATNHFLTLFVVLSACLGVQNKVHALYGFVSVRCKDVNAWHICLSCKHGVLRLKSG